MGAGRLPLPASSFPPPSLSSSTPPTHPVSPPSPLSHLIHPTPPLHPLSPPASSRLPARAPVPAPLPGRSSTTSTLPPRAHSGRPLATPAPAHRPAPIPPRVSAPAHKMMEPHLGLCMSAWSSASAGTRVVGDARAGRGPAVAEVGSILAVSGVAAFVVTAPSRDDFSSTSYSGSPCAGNCESSHLLSFRNRVAGSTLLLLKK